MLVALGENDRARAPRMAQREGLAVPGGVRGSSTRSIVRGGGGGDTPLREVTGAEAAGAQRSAIH